MHSLLVAGYIYAVIVQTSDYDDNSTYCVGPYFSKWHKSKTVDEKHSKKKKVLRAFSMNLYSRYESEQQHWLMGTNAYKICVFSSQCHLGTQNTRWQQKKKGKIQGSKSHGRQKNSNETLRKQKLVHPLMSSNCLVDSYTSSTRWSSCSRKNRIPGDDTQIRKPFTSFVSEHPVLALPQHVTLKPKWHWGELHKHRHVVNPAGACCRDVTTWIFFLGVLHARII